MKRIILSIIVAGIWAFCFCPSLAQAEPITIAIEAKVDSVEDRDGYLEGKINPGDIITGTYTYDSSTPDTNPSPYIGDYEHFAPPAGIFLTVGGFEFRTDPMNVNFLVEVGNAGGPYYRDNYLIRSYKNLPLYDDVPINHIMWQLDDKSGTAISSDALPLTAPVLHDWPDSFTGLKIEGGDIKNSLRITADVTSAIPEPATVMLLTLGGLIVRRRTKR